jgi:hypothetical protein
VNRHCPDLAELVGKAIGQLHQADRSLENHPIPVIPAKLVPAKAGSGNPTLSRPTWTPAYAGVTATKMPDGSTQWMDGAAMDLSFRPLKGTVSGTRFGTRFLVRTFTGLGTVGAYLVGNGGSSGFYGPLSESALLRSLF